MGRGSQPQSERRTGLLLAREQRPQFRWVDRNPQQIRLPKAVGFDPAYIRDGNYQTPHGYFCLNESGEVTGYIPA